MNELFALIAPKSGASPEMQSRCTYMNVAIRSKDFRSASDTTTLSIDPKDILHIL